MEPYNIIQPTAPSVPIVVSVPHCGTAFPPELARDYVPALSAQPDDTDWFVNKLYDFAPALGMVMITANYSRWVIDLNRDPDSKPLYTDGRIITGLCPTTNFLGEPLYVDKRTEVSDAETKRRLENYYRPYHKKLHSLLIDTKNMHGKVLLWDCHSIRQYVETIYKEKFPDLILGDADGASSSPVYIDTAYRTLGSAQYSINHNFPFKGGYITRHYGKPLENQHALQLEMSKINYMDDGETAYDDMRAGKMRDLLQKTFTALIAALQPNKSV